MMKKVMRKWSCLQDDSIKYSKRVNFHEDKVEVILAKKKNRIRIPSLFRLQKIETYKSELSKIKKGQEELQRKI